MLFQWNPRDGSSLHCIQVELEFGIVGFCGGRKTGVPGEKPSAKGREPTTNSTHIRHRVTSAGIEPEPHWWEAAWEANVQPLRHPCSLQSLVIYQYNTNLFL